MTNTDRGTDRGSAKILAFPARGRFAASAQREQSNRTLEHALLPRMAKVASGSGWYHDEAIRDAERSRES